MGEDLFEALVFVHRALTVDRQNAYTGQRVTVKHRLTADWFFRKWSEDNLGHQRKKHVVDEAANRAVSMDSS